MAVHAVNCTVGSEGLCPTLLVFGALPRPIRTKPSPQQLRRAEIIEQAMTLVAKIQAQRSISYGLQQNMGPKGVDQSKELRKLPAGSLVLVYRTKSKQWEGPHMFISIDGETATVQTSRGRKIHRSNCVRPWTKSQLEERNGRTKEEVDDDDEDDKTQEDSKEDGEDINGLMAKVEIEEDTTERGKNARQKPNNALTPGIQKKNAPGFQKARAQ